MWVTIGFHPPIYENRSGQGYVLNVQADVVLQGF
jgi:hypothetical protein